MRLDETKTRHTKPDKDTYRLLNIRVIEARADFGHKPSHVAKKAIVSRVPAYAQTHCEAGQENKNSAAKSVLEEVAYPLPLFWLATAMVAAARLRSPR